MMGYYTNEQAIEKFLDVMKSREDDSPMWLHSVEIPYVDEARTGANAVAVTDIGRILLRVETQPGGIERFNLQYPQNAIIAIILYPSHDDWRVWDKSKHFIEKERLKRRSQRDW